MIAVDDADSLAWGKFGYIIQITKEKITAKITAALKGDLDSKM
jgi:hypothetical protein